MKRSNAAKKNESGFTFIEIIVVIVIIGIIAAIAVPKFVNLTGDAKKAAADGTIGAINSACSIAFAKHRASGTDTDDGTWIINAEKLATWLDGGYPEGVSGSGTTVKLQDGRTLTITPETKDNRAKVAVGSGS
ncbi:MAG: prepilin-type N-terminal cleavage/methylation domain-containing protein [Candidatus Omnitrophota bacterium]|jgi:MSHA pilin protein MshA|nr:MAG: prepilin-type N-terminal cleavage/methylation domain-containing protein [Candidatus Omnitrophota bacterium]